MDHFFLGGGKFFVYILAGEKFKWQHFINNPWGHKSARFFAQNGGKRISMSFGCQHLCSVSHNRCFVGFWRDWAFIHPTPIPRMWPLWSYKHCNHTREFKLLTYETASEVSPSSSSTIFQNREMNTVIHQSWHSPCIVFLSKTKRKYKNLHFLSSLQKQKEKISTLWLINLKNVITKLRQKIKGLGLWCLTSNWLKPDSKGKYAGAFNACAFESIPSTESRAQVWELLDHDYLYFNEIRMHFSMKGEYPFHTQ